MVAKSKWKNNTNIVFKIIVCGGDSSSSEQWPVADFNKQGYELCAP
jgi:hypothetical protein